MVRLGENEILAAFFREADATAHRIREYNEQRIEQRIAAEKRTIDIRVEKIAETKAVELAQKKLKDSQQWVVLEQQQQQLLSQKWENYKLWLLWLGRWIGSGRSGLLFYFVNLVVYVTIGGMIVINMPSRIACKSASSICYLFRWNKSTIVLPEQKDEILERYFEKYVQTRKKQHLHQRR